MDIFILLALALAPGVAIGLYIYLKDHHEREPIGLLLMAFFYGILATAITLLIGMPLGEYVPVNENDLTEQAIHAFLIVALLEELSKFLFVRGILYRNKNFNEPFDGIVYSVMVGMGFATAENVIYVFNGDGGMGTALLRMFTAVPAHASFAVLMGYFLGKAKFEHRKGHHVIYALVVATLFHGIYDYCLFVSFVPGIWLGAVGSLVLALSLGRKAMHIHQLASPFRPEATTVPVESPVDNTTQNS
jgi:RsiW-degrading membrane proteinase PrsW (M82 family)